MFKAYLKKIADTSNRGDAREESYYPALKDLFEEYSSSIGKKKIMLLFSLKRQIPATPQHCRS
jgi:hypothetical protein